MCGGVKLVHVAVDQRSVQWCECGTRRVSVITESPPACQERTLHCDLQFNDSLASVNPTLCAQLEGSSGVL
jgi:hypothetical protein